MAAIMPPSLSSDAVMTTGISFSFLFSISFWGASGIKSMGWSPNAFESTNRVIMHNLYVRKMICMKIMWKILYFNYFCYFSTCSPQAGLKASLCKVLYKLVNSKSNGSMTEVRVVLVFAQSC